jgi:hypothetical protein
LEPFLEWDFVPGAIPDEEQPRARRMDEFRDWLVRAYSAESASTESSGPKPHSTNGR